MELKEQMSVLFLSRMQMSKKWDPKSSLLTFCANFNLRGIKCWNAYNFGIEGIFLKIPLKDQYLGVNEMKDFGVFIVFNLTDYDNLT